MVVETKVLQACENDPLKTPERKRKREEFDETILWAPKRVRKPLAATSIRGRILFSEGELNDREVDMTFLERASYERSLFGQDATVPVDSENSYRFK